MDTNWKHVGLSKKESEGAEDLVRKFFSGIDSPNFIACSMERPPRLIILGLINRCKVHRIRRLI